MRLFYGVIGDEAKHYKHLLAGMPESACLENENGFIVNMGDGSLQCPSQIAWGKKVLLINGPFFLRDYTADDFISNQTGCLQSLMKLENNLIPREFVNGAFNAVIIENNSLWLFNDFMALDPLYYHLSNRTLFIANDLRFLNRILKAQWDEAAISEYLALGYNFSYRTLLKGVQCLPPATILFFKDGNTTLSNYATYPKNPEIKANQKEIVEQTHEALIAAVNRVYSSKLKYSMSLTGGMDSRLIYFAWPDRKSLLTETAGKDSSDYLKARDLAGRIGNPSLHALEDFKDEFHLSGKIKFYELCDNPGKLLAEFNYFHLMWKLDRGADFHLTGVGGEHLNGENLYLNRKPAYVLKEAFLPYSYRPLIAAEKKTLIADVLYSKYKSPLLALQDSSISRLSTIEYAENVVAKLDDYLGNPCFSQTYIERFRTLIQANTSYYPLHVVAQSRDILVMPYNDRDLLSCISMYHPSSRELRRLQLALLRKFKLAPEIPVDTSHLLISRPYYAHKVMRALRMVLNIGMHKKIPLLQKGDPPKQRTYKYFDHTARDYREYVNEVIRGCSFFDRARIGKYLDQVGKVDKFNFYSHHREASNIRLLLRLAYSEKNLKKS